jgi:hypothetical protein
MPRSKKHFVMTEAFTQTKNFCSQLACWWQFLVREDEWMDGRKAGQCGRGGEKWMDTTQR